MDLIKKNLKELNDLGLRLGKLKNKSFEDTQKMLINQNIYDKVNIFINSLENCEVEGRLFLTAFAMKFHFEAMVGNINIKENYEIMQIIDSTLNEYEDLFVISLSESIIKNFCNKLNFFNEKIQIWKQQDLFKVIEEYAKMFWSLEMQKKNKELKEEHLKILQENQEKIKDLVKKIGGDEGMKQFEGYSPVIFDESAINNIKEQVETTYKKAYWDKLKEDMNNKNYDSLLLTLEEIRARIALLTPNRIDIHQSIAEYIDVELIKQMLEHDAMDNKFVTGLVNYIITTLKNLEAPIQNIKTETWREETLKLLEDTKDIPDLLTGFFQKVFDKIEVIENEVKMIKESKLYEKIKKEKLSK